MPEHHRVRIRVNRHGTGGVYLDGKLLQTTHVSVDSPAGKMPVVTMSVYADVDITAEVPKEALTVTDARSQRATVDGFADQIKRLAESNAVGPIAEPQFATDLIEASNKLSAAATELREHVRKVVTERFIVNTGGKS